MRRAGQHSRCWPSGARGGRVPSLLELYGCEIAQGRVQAPLVVDLIDKSGSRVIASSKLW
jgi:hypothetical protein